MSNEKKGSGQYGGHLCDICQQNLSAVSAGSGAGFTTPEEMASALNDEMAKSANSAAKAAAAAATSVYDAACKSAGFEPIVGMKEHDDFRVRAARTAMAITKDVMGEDAKLYDFFDAGELIDVMAAALHDGAAFFRVNSDGEIEIIPKDAAMKVETVTADDSDFFRAGDIVIVDDGVWEGVVVDNCGQKSPAGYVPVRVAGSDAGFYSLIESRRLTLKQRGDEVPDPKADDNFEYVESAGKSCPFHGDNDHPVAGASQVPLYSRGPDDPRHPRWAKEPPAPPRVSVTPDSLAAIIEYESCIRVPGTNTLVCVIRARGFEFTGFAYFVNDAEFSYDTGYKHARNDAMKKLYESELYALRRDHDTDDFPF